MHYYKLFDHTADIGVEISGWTKQDLFANAASAVFDILIENRENKTAKAIDKRQKTLTVEGTDVEDLLINFLRELLSLFNGEGWVVSCCEILECDNKRLKARLMGEPYSKKKHLIKTEIKAVTYYGLKVDKVKADWKARIIFDV